jgi:integrase
MMVPDRLLPVIDAAIQYVSRDDNRLFPLNEKSLSLYWTRTMKTLGIDDLHFHDLRHEGCSRLAEDGLSIPEIQQVSLHESWGSLQIYVNMRKRKTERVEYDLGYVPV